MPMIKCAREGCREMIEVKNLSRHKRQYHSHACRQKAFREREKKRNPTKPKPKKFAGYCKCCGGELWSRRPKQTKYCEPACRQEAYRQRKAAQEYVVVIHSAPPEPMPLAAR